MGNYLVPVAQQRREENLVLVTAEAKETIDAFVEALYDAWYKHTHSKFGIKTKYVVKSTPFVSKAPPFVPKGLGLIWSVWKLIGNNQANRAYLAEALKEKNISLKVGYYQHFKRFIEVRKYSNEYETLYFDWSSIAVGYPQKYLHPMHMIYGFVEFSLDKLCSLGQHEFELSYDEENKKFFVHTLYESKPRCLDDWGYLLGLFKKHYTDSFEEFSVYSSTYWPEVHERLNKMLENFSQEYGVSVTVTLISDEISKVSIKKCFGEERGNSGFFVTNIQGLPNVMYERMLKLSNFISLMSPALPSEHNGLIHIQQKQKKNQQKQTDAEYVTFDETGCRFVSSLDKKYATIAEVCPFEMLNRITTELISPYMFKKLAVRGFIAKMLKKPDVMIADCVEKAPSAEKYRQEIEGILKELDISLWIVYVSKGESIEVSGVTLKRGLFPEINSYLTVEKFSEIEYLNTIW